MRNALLLRINEMGILRRLRTRIFRSHSKNGRDVLTVASSNMADSTSISIVKELATSPHYGAIVSASSHSVGQNPQEFFANDFEKALYDDEETMMESLLLLHASNCSSLAGGENHDDQTSMSCRDEEYTYPTSSDEQLDSMSCRDEYTYLTSSDEELEIQTVMEPSFEVALMESIASDSFPLESQYEGHEAPHTQQSSQAMSAEEVMMDLEKDLLATRYDHDGDDFIHIYDQGLSTLPESPSFLEEASPRAPPSKMMTIQPCISDDQKLETRWALAKHDFGRGGKEFEPPSPSRSPSHSRRARMWLKAFI